jgi:hypothetical protein
MTARHVAGIKSGLAQHRSRLTSDVEAVDAERDDGLGLRQGADPVVEAFGVAPLRREASRAQGVVRYRRPPLRATQSGILRILPPRLGNRRRPNARRGVRAADQYLQKFARKQTAKRNRWEELGDRFGPCVQIPRQVERYTVLA